MAATAGIIIPQLGGSSGGSDVVATVNGRVITKDDLYNAMYEQIGEQAIEQLINTILIEQEARRQNITVSNDEIQAEIDKLAEQYGGRETLETLLEQSGSSLKSFEDNIRINLYIERLLADEIEVTDEQVREYYDNNQDAFYQDEQVRARHILVEDSALARELLIQLRNGADFAELAEKHSIDPGSAANGGDLGWFPRGRMVEPFEEAAFNAEPGELVGPVESEYGFHIIEVLERKPAGVQPFEEVKDQIRENLVNEQLQEKVLPWLQNLRAAADIQR